MSTHANTTYIRHKFVFLRHDFDIGSTATCRCTQTRHTFDINSASSMHNFELIYHEIVDPLKSDIHATPTQHQFDTNLPMYTNPTSIQHEFQNCSSFIRLFPILFRLIRARQPQHWAPVFVHLVGESAAGPICRSIAFLWNMARNWPLKALIFQRQGPCTDLGKHWSNRHVTQRRSSL